MWLGIPYSCTVFAMFNFLLDRIYLFFPTISLSATDGHRRYVFQHSIKGLFTVIWFYYFPTRIKWSECFLSSRKLWQIFPNLGRVCPEASYLWPIGKEEIVVTLVSHKTVPARTLGTFLFHVWHTCISSLNDNRQ